jgi:golgi-specific brefeldin A-resistance guanine nucleotide exchange factor 1
MWKVRRTSIATSHPSYLRIYIDVRSLPLTTLLGPFFAIIRSPLSTGPITSAALSALHSFFQCNLICPGAISLDVCLNELSNTVSRCKFEASDSSGDEVTLLKIMTVIQDCMCSSVGENLGDIEVCEMLETVLTTCCQMRLSGGLSRPLLATEHHVLTGVITLEEILRRCAEATMHALVKTAFCRLYILDPEEEEHKLAKNDDTGQDGEAKMTVSTHISEHPENLLAAEGGSALEPQPTTTTQSSTSPGGPKPRCAIL